MACQEQCAHLIENAESIRGRSHSARREMAGALTFSNLARRAIDIFSSEIRGERVPLLTHSTDRPASTTPLNKVTGVRDSISSITTLHSIESFAHYNQEDEERNNMMPRSAFTFIGLMLLVGNSLAFSVMPTMAATTAVAPAPEMPATKSVVSKVAVTGATGRTGRYVVEELLKRDVPVVAMVRDEDKAKELFSDLLPKGLEVVTCDLTSESAIDAAVNGCDAAIWCATGFSDAPGDSLVDKLKKLVGIALAPKQSIDSVGIPALAKSFESAPKETKCPKVVMLSSAGVTRPSWDEEKKAKFPGSAEIPIVRLNPFGILDIKAESEEKLRQSGVDYCIVRPTGLNDDWPAGSRPVFTQGDVAVGRTNRKDVAKILVDVLFTPEATGKTFEVITLAGYPPATSIDSALSKLKTDKEGLPSMESIEATYTAMQQLLPGEKQDSTRIALGQTYEQLDKGEEGRFGPRENEQVEKVTMRPTN